MAKIMFIRHAEKPTAKDAGVTPKGVADKEDLIVLGWQRAGALARFFAPKVPANITPGIATPAALFAAAANKKEGSMRPQHTILPLSKLLGIKTNASFGKGDEAPLIAAVKAAAQTGVVLVAWQHTDIPAFVQAIAGNGVCPAKWPGKRFDMVWVLDSTSNGGWAFSQVPQLLLDKDSPDPITK